MANSSERLVAVGETLAAEVEALRFGPPVVTVYNPLVYAWDVHRRYLERLARARPPVLLLGMNPGPFGMAQTGIPFGDPVLVRDWLGLEGSVGRPDREHPKRPVLGFASPRREVSGRRLWGWARDRFGSADRFLTRFGVLNYCPLCFLEASGRNRTPDRLPAPEREALFAACDRALVASVEVLAPRAVVGVGTFAERRAREALGDGPPTVSRILHPSPASPAANRGWVERIESELAASGLADS